MGISEHSPTQTRPDGGLYSQVVTSSNLFSAWLSVRSKAKSSMHQPTRAEASFIDENPIKFIRRVQSRLRKANYEFPAQRGVIKTKKSSGKRRGIVVSPIEGRVVQRALLNVLQTDNPKTRQLLGEVPEHLRCPTSVGGVPERGVAYAVNLIQNAIQSGLTHYIRSDIKGFFDNVRRADISEYLGTQINCSKTIGLFSSALNVEFSNLEEIRENLDLFPDAELGVAQGNSLSCLAANLALREFDALMNGRGVVTIRYVDDFIVLGKSISATRKALSAGVAKLKELGLEAYTPQERPDKASEGRTTDGVEFLGCYFRDGAVVPSAASRAKIISEIDAQFADAKKRISQSIKEGKPRRAEPMFAQEIVAIDRKIRGWGDAYQFNTDDQIFHDLDARIQDRLRNFHGWFKGVKAPLDQSDTRRAWGIALLGDTPVLGRV